MSRGFYFCGGSDNVKQSTACDAALLDKLEPALACLLLTTLLEYITKSGNTDRAAVASRVEQTALQSCQLQLDELQRLAKSLLHILKLAVSRRVTAAQLSDDFRHLGVSSELVSGGDLTAIWTRFVPDISCHPDPAVPDVPTISTTLKRTNIQDDAQVAPVENIERVQEAADDNVQRYHDAKREISSQVEISTISRDQRPEIPSKPSISTANKQSSANKVECEALSSKLSATHTESNPTRSSDAETDPTASSGEKHGQTPVSPQSTNISVLVSRFGGICGRDDAFSSRRCLESSDCRIVVTVASSDQTRRGRVCAILRLHWAAGRSHSTNGADVRSTSSCIQLSPNELVSLLSQLTIQLSKLNVT